MVDPDVAPNPRIVGPVCSIAAVVRARSPLTSSRMSRVKTPLSESMAIRLGMALKPTSNQVSGPETRTASQSGCASTREGPRARVEVPMIPERSLASPSRRRTYPWSSKPQIR